MSDDVEKIARGLLAERDEAANICPVNRPSWSGGKNPCPLCGATPRDPCPKVSGADHAFVEAVRSYLKDHDA